ncbi:hypothetical protein NKG94_31105 [Micromonospora sp. M12]
MLRPTSFDIATGTLLGAAPHRRAGPHRPADRTRWTRSTPRCCPAFPDRRA